MFIQQILFLQLFMTCFSLDSNKPNLHIIGLFEDDTYFQSVKTAVEDINNRPDVLFGYNLTLVDVNTDGCIVGFTNVELFKLLYTPPTKVMIVGNGCSDVCLITGQYVHFFNLVQISYKAVATELRNRTRYPTFFRTLHSNTGFIHARLLLMKEFGWNRVGSVIVESGLNDQLTEGFQKALQNSNNSLLLNEKFIEQSELPQILEKLKERHIRIIFASFIWKKEAFCEIYRQKLYGPHYVWIISTFVKDWWYENETISCTEEEFLEALEGSFHMKYDRHEYKPEETFSRKDKTLLLNGDELYTAAYDAMWAAAIALDATSKELQTAGKRLEDFNYNNSEIGKVILNNMQKVNFNGLSEFISFDEEGDIRVQYVLHRVIGGKAEVVGHVAEKSLKIDWQQKIVWKGDGNPPADQPEIKFLREQHPKALYAVICVITSLGLILTLALILFNRFLHFSRISLTSSNLDLLFLIGCFVVLISLFVESSEDISQLNCCIGFRFLFYIGFSLAVGSLFVKIWRIHMISVNALARLTDQRLFIMVGFYLIINLLVLIIKEGADPSFITLHNKTSEDMDTHILVTQIAICDSNKGVYFRVVLCFIQGFILIFSSYLSWETRKASFPGLRDSRIIGMCIYNILVLGIVGAGISIVVEHPTIDYSIRVACILIAIIATECIIFITKIRHYRSGKLEQDDLENPEIVKNNMSVPPSSTSYPPQHSTTLETTVTDGLDEISKVIEERNKVIANMHNKLELQDNIS